MVRRGSSIAHAVRAPAQVKPDNPAENKFFFLCQTPGCGAVINPAFPVADKNPSPKWCKDCQVKEMRDAIKAEWDVRQQ